MSEYADTLAEYADILSTVVENGRCNPDGEFVPELLEPEIEFECGERGLSAEQTAEAIEYAHAHIQR